MPTPEPPRLIFACPGCGRWYELPVRVIAEDVIEVPTPLCARHRHPLHMRQVDPLIIEGAEGYR